MDGRFFQKIFQNGAKMEGFGRLGGVLGGLGASWGFLGCLGGVLGRLVTVLGASWGFLGSKRWPTWLHLGSQNGAQIGKKSKPNAIKIWMPLGVGFLKDFGGFGKAKWSQVGTRIASKIDPNFERRCFEKTMFFLRKTMILKVLGVEVGTKNRSKIDQKMKSSWEGILASIFHGFWSIWEAKLAPSWGRK